MEYPRTALSLGGAVVTAAAGLAWLRLTGSPLLLVAVPVVAVLLPMAWSMGGGRRPPADGEE